MLFDMVLYLTLGFIVVIGGVSIYWLNQEVGELEQMLVRLRKKLQPLEK